MSSARKKEGASSSPQGVRSKAPADTKHTPTPLKQSPAHMRNTIELLRKNQNFANMSLDTLQRMLKEAQHLQIPAGHELIRKTDETEGFFILLKGVLWVRVDGRLVAHLDTPGEVVGELRAIFRTNRTADVISKTKCSLLVFYRAPFSKNPLSLEGLRWSNEFYTMLSSTLAFRVQETTKRAKLYEESVLEMREMASTNALLESRICEKLREIRAFARVIEQAPFGVLIADNEGSVWLRNPAARIILSRLKANNLRTLHLNDLAQFFDASAFLHGPLREKWAGEWCVHNDPNQVYRVRIAPIQISNETSGTLCILSDISSQKSQTREIAEKTKENEHAFAELEHTYEALRRGETLKQETLEILAGELQSPLQSILSHFDVLKEQLNTQELSAPIQEHLGIIQDQTQQLKLIAENIGTLAELQNGNEGPETEMVDLQELLQQVTEQCTHLIERKQAKLRVQWPVRTVLLRWNAQQLRTILTTLMQRALQNSIPRKTLNIRVQYKKAPQSFKIIFAYPPLASQSTSQEKQSEANHELLGSAIIRRALTRQQGLLTEEETPQEHRIQLLLPQQANEETILRHVLIYESNEIDRQLIQGVVEHFTPGTVVSTYTEPFRFLEQFDTLQPDLVVLDPQVNQPGWSNHRLLAMILRQRKHVCPTLCVSALYTDPAERGIAFERGVSDFLAKPYSLFDLQFKVKALLNTYRRERALHRNVHQASRMARTDALTQLANRKHFDEFLQTQVGYSLQLNKPCSLILIDIDHFKHFNDQHGHMQGDELLRKMGTLLSSSVRASDLAARYGGEEFVLVLPETPHELALLIAEKVRRKVEQHDSPEVRAQPLGCLSVSLGVATLPEDARSTGALIQASDECLYDAKRSGRNRVRGTLSTKFEGEKASTKQNKLASRDGKAQKDKSPSSAAQKKLARAQAGAVV